MSSIRAVLGVLLLSVTLVACGGDSRLSNADYTKQATAICTQSNKDTDALPEPKAVADLAPYLEKGTAITEKSVAQFKDLQPPKDLQSKHDAAVAALEAQIADLKALTADIKKGTDPTAAIKAAQSKLDAESAKVKSTVTALGLAECAK